MRIEHFGLGFATGAIQGAGTLNLSPQRIALHVDLADLSLAALSSLLDHSLPTLDGKLGGQVHVESPSFDIEHPQASGQLSLMARTASQQPTPSASPLSWPFRLTADFRFAAGTLTLAQTAWAMDGFKGQGSGTQSLDGMTQLSGTLDADLTAPIFRSLGLQSIHGNMQATFGLQGRLADPRVTAEIQVQQARYRGFAMDHLRVAGDAEGAEVTIRSLTGVQDQARYHLHGALTLASPFSRSHRPLGLFPIRAIRELQLQIEQADLTAFASLLPMPAPLAGALTLHVSGAGTWPDVHGEGEIAVRGLVVRGDVVGDVSVLAAGSSTNVAFKRLVAQLGGGEIHANGTLNLPRHLLDVTATWQGVPVERLAFLPYGVALPVSGALSGSIEARGVWPHINAVIAVQGPQLQAYGLEVADLQLLAKATPRDIQLDRLATRLSGAPLTATGRADIGGPIDFRLSTGSVPLRGLTLTPNLVLNGRVKLEFGASGTFAAPQLLGQVRLNGVRLGDLAIGTGTLALSLNDRRISFSSAGLQGFNLDGSVALHGALSAQVRLGMRGFDLGPIVARLAGNADESILGDVSGTVEVSGPLRSPPQLTGLVTLDHLRLRSNGIEVVNSAPLRWRLEHGMLRFEAVRLQAHDAHLELRGTVDLWRERLDVAILGKSPLAIVGTRLSGLRFQQGTLETQLNIHGRLMAPDFDGRVFLTEGAIYIDAINENLSQLDGEIQFADHTISIRSVQGRLAGGNLGVTGEARLQGLQLDAISMTTQMSQVRLRYPAGLSTVLDAELVLSGNAVQQLVTGEVHLSRARYRQDFDLAALLRQWRQRALEPPTVAQQRLQLDIHVASLNSSCCRISMCAVQ
ncbi:MAG TPA: AsmA-like C-terminal region-containing protein [Alphaproteobacteria bacterium]|nr:AsmA-like C-terminal region-containing protein [Alphaproteobacteria bacterium]